VSCILAELGGTHGVNVNANQLLCPQWIGEGRCLESDKYVFYALRSS